MILACFSVSGCQSMALNPGPSLVWHNSSPQSTTSPAEQWGRHVSRPLHLGLGTCPLSANRVASQGQLTVYPSRTDF